MLTKIDVIYQYGNNSAEYTTYESFTDLFLIYPEFEKFITEDLMKVKHLDMVIVDINVLIKITIGNIYEYTEIRDNKYEY